MGYKFDSKWEAERYGQLASMQMAGIIENLERQVKFDIIVNDCKICKYIAEKTEKKKKLLKMRKVCKHLILN